MGEDNRLNNRIDFHLEVVVKGYPGIKKTRNFSTSGIYIELEDPSRFKLRQRVELVTRFPLEKKIMKIKGEVAHINQSGIGVKFVDLWGSNLDAVENTFRIFQATYPLPGT